MAEKTKSHLDFYLDWLWVDIRFGFTLTHALRTDRKTVWKCVTKISDKETAVVWCTSDDRCHIRGAVICAPSFTGVRGDVDNSELAYVREHNPQHIIKR